MTGHIFEGHPLIFVAAGRYSTARREMREIGLPGGDWGYVSRMDSLRGTPRYSPILFLDDFAQHHDAENIRYIARARSFREIKRADIIRALAAFKSWRAGDKATNFTTSNGVTVTIIVNPAHKPRVVNEDGSIREVEPGWEGDMLKGPQI